MRDFNAPYIVTRPKHSDEVSDVLLGVCPLQSFNTDLMYMPTLKRKAREGIACAESSREGVRVSLRTEVRY